MSQQRRLYFDNAATSFPKPARVLTAMQEYASSLGASPGRGAYREAREAGERLHTCRVRLATLLNAPSPYHIIFTLNTTDALNLAIHGLFRPNQPNHAITTRMDHNSVLRPLNRLRSEALLEQTRVPVDPDTGIVDPEDIRRAIRPDTRFVAVVHASNVSGSIQPIAEIGAICREMAVPLIVDAAQSVGHIPVDVQAMNIDLLAIPGHKGLLGPLGTGALVIRPGLERSLRTLREGGTGSLSEHDIQPDTLPDKYEPGSHNAIGIIGLSAGVAWLLERSIEAIAAHEQELIEQFLRGIHSNSALNDPEALLPGLRLLGPRSIAQRTGVFSVTVDGLPPARLAQLLEDRYAILTRAGLHCAPLAHETFRTSPEHTGSAETAGATRFSLGPFLTPQDVRYATDALAEICEQHARSPFTAASN